MTATEDLEDGVYFDMPHDVYIRLPRIGSGGIKDLICSTATFWWNSWMNPDRPAEEIAPRDARSIGTAFHMARLEPDRFAATYAAALDVAAIDGGDLLRTDTDVCARLAELGETQRKKGEASLDRARRLAELDPDARILAVLDAQHQEANFGRVLLPPDIMRAAERSIAIMSGDPEIARRLTGGFPEVSILWTSDKGVRLRARIDYLQATEWSDVKTFQNAQRKPLDVVFAQAFRFNGYMSQAALYDMAVEEIRRGALPVRVFDADKLDPDVAADQQAMIDDLREQPNPLDCWYVFAQSDGSPNICTRKIILRDFVGGHDANGAGVDEDTLPSFMHKPSRVLLRGRMDVDKALRLYGWAREAFLPGEPWTPAQATGVIDEDAFNPHYLEGYDL